MDRFVQKGCACRVVLARLKHQANYTTNSVESGVTYSFFANCTAESTSTLSLHRSPPVAPAMAPYVRGRRGVVVFRSTGNKCSNFKTVCRDQSITRQKPCFVYCCCSKASKYSAFAACAFERCSYARLLVPLACRRPPHLGPRPRFRSHCAVPRTNHV